MSEAKRKSHPLGNFRIGDVKIVRKERTYHVVWEMINEAGDMYEAAQLAGTILAAGHQAMGGWEVKVSLKRIDPPTGSAT